MIKKPQLEQEIMARLRRSIKSLRWLTVWTVIGVSTVAVLQSGCSSQAVLDPQRPASQFALTTNLADDFGRLYPKVYVNGNYVFRDKLLLVPKTYQFKMTYLDTMGKTHEENMQVTIKANQCYYLERKNNRFRFNVGVFDESDCSAKIDQARYDLTYRTS
ncbi:hypothetical protein THMIRHAS_05990 [Thiosulfatimonas sediminis]|uniref:Uncharacterized protein n=1 Tax=Thiosulfatimonas sediminis TaxID=2675054 RepID=A0A6F8PT11_9GAMM|nr:hypothetical protein [Thiosulfatimonas sediminis]BBP45226.1 hypothetical protein THMIRHAS_05990 [Thiosulfatimonas sediminis]